MEKLQLVRARGRRWRVADVHAHEGCTLVTLDGAEGSTFGETRRLLLPFDDIDRIAHSDRLHRVPLRRWRRACRALLATAAPPGGLRSAGSAQMDILPHQLEPALAVRRGLGCRVLLADDVGLGKTIQAGLILSELLARRCVERVLVLTPSGIRWQWAEELSTRFGIAAFTADARTLRQLAAALPLGMNPWLAEPVTIASLDYVKREEVLPAVTACRWDVIVIDEAHAGCGESERGSAVERLAARASYVILVSATPHSGDAAAFARLCDVGSCAPRDEPILVFRRTRQIVRPHALRRVRLLHVRPTREELRMFEALGAYERAVRAERSGVALALSVLRKRAFSSPWALAQSVARRLSALNGAEDSNQLELPLSDAEGELDLEDAAPAWPPEVALADSGRERRLLQAVFDAAEAATIRRESKLVALTRFVRRARESALIFTEYRDTAAHVQAAIGNALLLHGGLRSAERHTVLAAFERQPGRLLVATDAAGQGLNLQRACRLVVNLELPWNPTRLEQRIGRVDRIGQTRRVHALHLVGRTTGEEEILERLDRRVDRALADIGAADPLHNRGASEPAACMTSETDHLAAKEATRLAWCRALLRPGDRSVLRRLEVSSWWAARGRRAMRSVVGRLAICVYEATLDDALGTTVASCVFGVLQPAAADDIQPSASQTGAPYETHLAAWAAQAIDVENRFWRARLDREQAIAAKTEPNDPMFQPALFDRRAERERVRSREDRDRLFAALARRRAQAERQATFAPLSIRLLLVLLP